MGKGEGTERERRGNGEGTERERRGNGRTTWFKCGTGGGRVLVLEIRYILLWHNEKSYPPFLPLPPQAINNDGSLNTTFTSVVFTAKQNKTAARKDGTYVFLFLRHKTIEFPNFWLLLSASFYFSGYVACKQLWRITRSQSQFSRQKGQKRFLIKN